MAPTLVPGPSCCGQPDASWARHSQGAPPKLTTDVSSLHNLVLISLLMYHRESLVLPGHRRSGSGFFPYELLLKLYTTNNWDKPVSLWRKGLQHHWYSGFSLPLTKPVADDPGAAGWPIRQRQRQCGPSRASIQPKRFITLAA